MSEWIKCDQKLPPSYEHVLVFSSDSLNIGVFRAYRDENDRYPSWQCYPIGSYAGDGCVFNITHWMPLPEPPEDR